MIASLSERSANTRRYDDKGKNINRNGLELGKQLRPSPNNILYQSQPNPCAITEVDHVKLSVGNIPGVERAGAAK